MLADSTAYTDNVLIIEYEMKNITKHKNMKILSKHTIVFLSVLLFTGCASMKLNRLPSNFSIIPEATKELDIPKYDTEHQFNGYPFVYWHFCKQKEKQLGLDNIEFSEDSLIFRIWITNPVGRKGQPHGLIEIKHDFSKWTGKLYYMYVDFDAKNVSETITDYGKIDITPKKNNWDFIIDSLYKLNFDALPTDDAIPNYHADNLGYHNNLPTFSFEYSTKEQYRFYQYNNLARKSNEFWQAKNAFEILKLLDDELNWNDLIEDSLTRLTPNKDYSYYAFRFDAGVFIPLYDLKNNLGISPHFGLYLGFPFYEKYRVDVGANFFIPVRTHKLEYILPNETLSGKASYGATMGVWASRSDKIMKSWFIDNRVGVGVGFLFTNIPKNNPKHENDTNYSSETVFLSLGTGIRKKRIGVSLNYYIVPYINLKPDFGSKHLTLSTYFTF